MIWLDYLIILAVVAVCVWIILPKKKATTGCCGNCAGCKHGCAKQ